MQSTPVNKKIYFEDDEVVQEEAEKEGDVRDSSDLERSFCPALTSTQIETPHISTKQGRKRKLSDLMEIDLSQELRNSKEIEVDSECNSYTKLKKKKRKKEKHTEEDSKQTEADESIGDTVSDTSNSKHKKKKKNKHRDRLDS